MRTARPAAAPARWRTAAGRGTGARVVVPLLTAVVLGAYLRHPPPVPDLAAQVARAAAAPATGSGLWWTGWFGGLPLTSYSATTPWAMHLLGVPVLGALAALATVVLTSDLVRSAPRPVAGAAAFAVFDVADLLVGRVTFAAGLALAALAVWALVRLRGPWGAAAAAAAAAACFLASPLAGLFAGVAALAVVAGDRSRRRTAALVALVLLVAAAAWALLLPSAGRMPTTALDVLPALGAAAAVALLCRPRVLRAAAVLSAAATALFLLAPGAVGENATRLAWVAATPVVVAFGRAPARLRRLRRGSRAALVVGAALATAVAPVLDVVHQLAASRDRSTAEAFYRPLLEELEAQRAREPSLAGARVEVVDPRTHWSSVWLAERVPLARGWDRQADAALDPLFYAPGALDAAGYGRWLRSLAVGWVAVPDAPLDYASAAEARLVASGAAGLRRDWTGPGWALYRVVDPAPLVEGASLVAVDPAGVTVDAPRAATVLLRVRFDPSLVARGRSGQVLAPTALAPTGTGMVTARLPAGRWRISPDAGVWLSRRWAAVTGSGS